MRESRTKVAMKYNNIPYGQSSAKLPVTRSLSHSVTRSLVTPVILSSAFSTLSHTNTQTNRQHQGLQVCFADNNVLAGDYKEERNM